MIIQDCELWCNERIKATRNHYIEKDIGPPLNIPDTKKLFLKQEFSSPLVQAQHFWEDAKSTPA